MSERSVTIVPVTPPGPAVTFELVDRVDLTGGAGGWAQLARPRRTAALEWEGTPLRAMTIPLILDGMEVQAGVDRSVESDVAALRSWGLPSPQTGEPPKLRLAGPLPATDGRWVLESVAWGEVTRTREGVRIQQFVTLTVTEFLAPTLVSSSPAKKARASRRNAGKPKDYDKKKPGIQNKQGVTRGGLE